MKIGRPQKPALTRRRLLTGAATALAGSAMPALALGGETLSVAQAQSPANGLSLVSAIPLSDRLPAPDWSRLEAGPDVVIDAVVDGDTVELERGPDVRLVGIQAPKLPLGRDHVDEWPLARLAKRTLESIIEDSGKRARLYFGGRRGDRHDRHLAHVVLEDGTWLQGAMVLAGLARVYTFADNRSLITDLLLREDVARSTEQNIWSHPFYAVRTASDTRQLLDRLNHFDLIEGLVLDAQARRERWYLNFGETWREDFTVTIDREHDPVFDDIGFDLSALRGAHVRVRGWLMEDGGPMIRVDHPEAIEVLRASVR
ncbi:MAG: thermonuclease family protein [Pseudomonadota bacterium]